MRRRFYTFYTSNDMFANYIKTVYNVTDTSSTTQLLSSNSNSTFIDSVTDMWIEKVSSTRGDSSLIQISPVKTYTFAEAGVYNVYIGISTTIIGDFAFEGCDFTGELVIPSGITFLGDYAFNSCSGMTSVSFPASLFSIRTGAFSSCSGLTSVTFPEGLNNLDTYAFSGCSGLTSISFPTSLVSIAGSAFSACSSLESIISKASFAPSIKSSTFSRVKTNGTLTVPTGARGYDVWMGTGNYYLGQ